MSSTQLWSPVTAQVYLQQWRSKDYLLRRVDTIEVLDRDLLERRITLDLDGLHLHKLRGLLSSSNDYDADSSSVKSESPNAPHEVELIEKPISALVVPLLEVPNGPFFDVDFSDSNGKRLHICRRSVNIQVSAHIAVGICQEAGLVLTDCQSLYVAVCGFLRGEVEGADFIAKFSYRAAATLGRHAAAEFQEFIDTRRTSFILCGRVPIPADDVTLVKIRFTTPLNQSNPSRFTTGSVLARPLSMHGKQSHCDVHAKPDPWRKRLRAFAISLFDFSKIGLTATWLPLPSDPLGGGFHPAHLRFVAPRGSILDDYLFISGATRDPYSPSPDRDVAFHHERIRIVDKGLDSGRAYRFEVKLNPKRGPVIVPALVASVLLFILSILCIASEPANLGRSSAWTAALFIVPTASIVFLAREGEHDFVSQMLAPRRLLVVALSVIAVFAGAATAFLPRFQNAAFATLFVLSISSYMSIMIFGMQIVRISRMRYLMHRRRRCMVPDHNEILRVGEIERADDVFSVFKIIAILLAAAMVLGYALSWDAIMLSWWN